MKCKYDHLRKRVLRKKLRLRLHAEIGASCKQAPAETSECLLCELVEICILILSVLRISGQRKLDAIKKTDKFFLKPVVKTDVLWYTADGGDDQQQSFDDAFEGFAAIRQKKL